MSATNQKIKMGIIGCGQMGSSIALRLNTGHLLYLCDRNFEHAQQLAGQVNGTALQRIEELVKKVDIILLAVKPQDMTDVAYKIKPHLKPSQLLISILAGIPLALLKEHFGDVNQLRMMPNLALKYSQGVIGLSDNGSLSQEFKHRIEKFFSPLGALHWISEKKMDALTALTGSGPAFVFTMYEAMVDAAIAMGFPADHAQSLVQQMLKGSLTLIEETKTHPGELKWKVCSPAGTTIAGLIEMERAGVKSGIIQTFLAAFHRSQELGHANH